MSNILSASLKYTCWEFCSTLYSGTIIALKYVKNFCCIHAKNQTIVENHEKSLNNICQKAANKSIDVTLNLKNAMWMKDLMIFLSYTFNMSIILPASKTILDSNIWNAVLLYYPLQ